MSERFADVLSGDIVNLSAGVVVALGLKRRFMLICGYFRFGHRTWFRWVVGIGKRFLPCEVAAFCRLLFIYIRNGGDPFSLQEILGHLTLEMVRNYVNLASRDVYEQHRKFSPMDRLLSNSVSA